VGINICLFAKNNKKYVHLGRYHSIKYYQFDAYISLPENDRDDLDAIYYKLATGSDRCTKFSDIYRLISTNLTCIKFDDPPIDQEYLNYYRGLNNIALAFINKYPDDEFFIVSDIDDPSYYGYFKTCTNKILYKLVYLDTTELFQYEEIKAEDLIKE